jgi:hypothetical protein
MAAGTLQETEDRETASGKALHWRLPTKDTHEVAVHDAIAGIPGVK